MSVLAQRQFRRDGSLDWRASIDATLAARPLARWRIPSRFVGLARKLPVGGCLHCSTPWGLVGAHTTRVVARNEHHEAREHNVFVLCEACWAELPIEARLVYYRAQYRLWLHDTARYPYGPKRDAAVIALRNLKPSLEAAVLAGR